MAVYTQISDILVARSLAIYTKISDLLHSKVLIFYGILLTFILDLTKVLITGRKGNEFQVFIKLLSALFLHFANLKHLQVEISTFTAKLK